MEGDEKPLSSAESMGEQCVCLTVGMGVEGTAPGIQSRQGIDGVKLRNYAET